MSAFFALTRLGRVAGAFLGGMLWSRAGLLPVCLVSGTGALLALFSLAMGFHPPRLQNRSLIIIDRSLSLDYAFLFFMI